MKAAKRSWKAGALLIAPGCLKRGVSQVAGEMRPNLQLFWISPRTFQPSLATIEGTAASLNFYLQTIKART